MLPTIQGSGASSSPSSADGQLSVTATGEDDWLPTGVADSTSSTSTAPTSNSDATGPRIVLETAHGHQMILTYQDLVLLALLGGLGAAAWRGMQ